MSNSIDNKEINFYQIDSDKFKNRAKQLVAENTDESIFGEKKVSEIFNDKDNLTVFEFEEQLKNLGFIEKDDETQKFLEAVNSDDDKEHISKDEALELFSDIYEAAYADCEKVLVQSWGSKDDDCISRIVNKHTQEIKLYSDDYNDYVKELCRLNNIENPDIIQAGALLTMPLLAKDENGDIIRDKDGKITFASPVEKSDIPAYANGQVQYSENRNEQGKLETVERYDENGNTTQFDFYNENEQCTMSYIYSADGSEVASTITYEYNSEGNISLAKHYKGEGAVEENLEGYTETNYSDDGAIKEEEYSAPDNQLLTTTVYDANGDSQFVENYQYENGVETGYTRVSNNGGEHTYVYTDRDSQDRVIKADIYNGSVDDNDKYGWYSNEYKDNIVIRTVYDNNNNIRMQTPQDSKDYYDNGNPKYKTYYNKDKTIDFVEDINELGVRQKYSKYENNKVSYEYEYENGKIKTRSEYIYNADGSTTITVYEGETDKVLRVIED